MAVITLHRPGTLTRSDVHLGNYLDLSTERVHIFQATDDTAVAEFQAACASAPPGSLIANLDNSSVKVDMAIIADGGDEPWFERRKQFDKMTYEDIGDGTSVIEQDYAITDLADTALALKIGTIALIRFADHDGRMRYFRFIVQQVVDDSGVSAGQGFSQERTALQFEEVEAGRIVVPLGISATNTGFVITTTQKIPAHFVSRDVSSLVWSIRPADRDFVGPDTYDVPFPVATVVFRVELPATEELRSHIHRYLPHPPPWVGSITQRNLSARSYLNTTYCVAVNHRGRRHRSELREVRDEYQDGADHTVRTVRYWYALTLVDGSTMSFTDYDPPVDVEDEH